MRRRRNPRIGPAHLDRVLGGHSPGPSRLGLAALLHAVRAPASSRELAGERAAVAAFVTAQRGTGQTVTPKRSSRVRTPSLARAATFRVAAAVVVLAAGGTAAAAEIAALPRSLQQQAHSWFSPLGVPAPAVQTPSSGGRPIVAAPSPEVATTQPAPGARRSDPPLPMARGLCRAWRTARDTEHGEPMTAESRRMLATMAGRGGNVAAFCAPYLTGSSAASTPGPTTSPTHPGNGIGNGDGIVNGNRAGNGNNGSSELVQGRAGPT